MEWQPIKTAPIWKLVIVYEENAVRSKSSKNVFTAVQVEQGKWELSSKVRCTNPSKWMPLPPPPKE